MSTTFEFLNFDEIVSGETSKTPETMSLFVEESSSRYSLIFDISSDDGFYEEVILSPNLEDVDNNVLVKLHKVFTEPWSVISFGNFKHDKIVTIAFTRLSESKIVVSVYNKDSDEPAYSSECKLDLEVFNRTFSHIIDDHLSFFKDNIKIC
ncbi:gp74 [Sphingomonas phage PAU]|uniref:gp74 n=1 Tax=Sphingomonas phage PAU TaxID=1150991 RepID=UPI00025731D4|nr:gp74 [Sphingomonas phage PAU]AFF28072.1 gp74 [Sphingomonas phage PAU]